MGALAVLVYKPTKKVVFEGNYPNEDNSPIVGDPNYEWLIKHTPFEPNPYDPRLCTMLMELPDMAFFEEFQEHPLYAGVREYKITYKPKPRTDAEIIVSIENAEKEANNSIVSEATHKDAFVFMLSSIDKKTSGLTLNETEQEPITLLQQMKVQLAKNKDNAEILKGILASGNEPNIDLGWVKTL